MQISGYPSPGTVSVGPEPQRRRCGVAHELFTCFTHLRVCCGHIKKIYEKTGVQNKRGEICPGQTGFIQSRASFTSTKKVARS